MDEDQVKMQQAEADRQRQEQIEQERIQENQRLQNNINTMAQVRSKIAMAEQARDVAIKEREARQKAKKQAQKKAREKQLKKAAEKKVRRKIVTAVAIKLAIPLAIIAIIAVIIIAVMNVLDKEVVASGANIISGGDVMDYIAIENDHYVIDESLYDEYRNELEANGLDPDSLYLGKNEKYLEEMVQAHLASDLPDLGGEGFNGIIKVLRRSYNADDADRYEDNTDQDPNKEIQMKYKDKTEFDDLLKDLKNNFDEDKYNDKLRGYFTIDEDTGATSSGSAYPGQKYELTDEQKRNLAYMVFHEDQNSEEGMKAVASHMCNLYEYYNWKNIISADNISFYDYITQTSAASGGSGWYATSDLLPPDESEEINQTALNAVEECIINGNRTLPLYINEFGPPSDIYPNTGEPGVTKVSGQGTSGTFWLAAGGGAGNVFFYTDEEYKEYCENNNTSSTGTVSSTTSSSTSRSTKVIKVAVYDGKTVKEEKIPYQTVTSKYSISMGFLLTNLQVSRNPEYVSALCDMVSNNSKIDLVVQETCTTIETYNGKESTTPSSTTRSIGVMSYVREADTWMVNAKQEYFKNIDISTVKDPPDADPWKKIVTTKITYKATPGGEVKEVVASSSSNNTVDPNSITGNRGTAVEVPEDVKNRMLGKSYKEEYASIVGITWDDLRYCQIPYIDFNGNRQIGEMILNKSVAEDALDIFEELYNIGYPIEKMRLIDEYNASDYQSIEDNNTSAFNMRGTNGSEITPGNVSNHSKGVCIDINPQMNPWIDGDTGEGSHENAREYWNRDYTQWSNETAKKAYIGEDSEIYRIFTDHGWRWLGGGKESGNSDTQHFDKVN